MAAEDVGNELLDIEDGEEGEEFSIRTDVDTEVEPVERGAEGRA